MTKCPDSHSLPYLPPWVLWNASCPCGPFSSSSLSPFSLLSSVLHLSSFFSLFFSLLRYPFSLFPSPLPLLPFPFSLLSSLSLVFPSPNCLGPPPFSLPPDFPLLSFFSPLSLSTPFSPVQFSLLGLSPILSSGARSLLLSVLLPVYLAGSTLSKFHQ